MSMTRTAYEHLQAEELTRFAFRNEVASKAAAMTVSPEPVKHSAPVFLYVCAACSKALSKSPADASGLHKWRCGCGGKKAKRK